MKLKYLNTKNSRRRGIAIELAIFVIMLCFGLSVIILTTSMIQKNNYNRVVSEYTEDIELNRIGGEFCSAIRKNEDIAYFMWKLEAETNYREVGVEQTGEIKYFYDIDVTSENKKLILSKETEDGSEVLLEVELTPVAGNSYKITKWELNQ